MQDPALFSSTRFGFQSETDTLRLLRDLRELDRIAQGLAVLLQDLEARVAALEAASPP